MDVLVKQGHTVKEQNVPSSMSLYMLPAEGVAQIKGVSSCLKIQIRDVSSFLKDPDLKWNHPLQTKQNIFHEYALPFEL